MRAFTQNVFLCNGATKPAKVPADAKVVDLSYSKGDPNRLVNLKLPRFVDQVYHLSPRILDLLEIAAYVFAGDRWTHRGPKDAVEFHAWPRLMRFAVRVREAEFWNTPEVKEKLIAALTFMTGDREYVFEFPPGHSTPPTSLFDREEFRIEHNRPTSVALFSGGLDSLTGVLDRLHSTQEGICLISHQSGQPSTKRTQKQLVKALRNLYPGRVHHYEFECGLCNVRAAEETQRTRAFLFGAIAFALANSMSLNSFFAYENGITSLNLLRRQDLINARASRTTHPKTLALMSSFLSEIQGTPVKVLNPFWQLTKTDIFHLIEKVNGRDLIGSAVSCSRTFQRLETATHCGCCFQCVDRKLAAYASGLNEVDNCGIYSKDILLDPIDSPEIKTTVLDYIRQAIEFEKTTDDQFVYNRSSELIDIVDYIGINDEHDALEKLWQLCNRHGKQVIAGLREIRRQLDDPRYRIKPGSLLQIIADREYLKDSPRRLAEQISKTLNATVPIAFKNRRPLNENELNDQISALLRAHGDEFKREFPTTYFANAKVIPDHEEEKANLLIEAKYLRKGTPPSKASDGIAADITKYPSDKFILFVVYDPDRSISDDLGFKKDLENKRSCLVEIIR